MPAEESHFACRGGPLVIHPGHSTYRQSDDGGMIEVSETPGGSRYVVTVDGQRAGFLDYRITGDVFIAVHTEIDSAYGGRGLGSQLVGRVLDDVRASGRRLRPVCPFVRHFLAENPQYVDLTRDRPA